MKKVKSIGKKVMSVGLAASLLMAPVSANKCFATLKEDKCKTVAISTCAAIGTLAMLWSLGEDGEKVSDALVAVLEGGTNLICAGFDTLWKIGLKNIVTGVGTWTIIKGIYGMVKSYIVDNDDE